MSLQKPLSKKQKQWLRLFDALDKRLTMPIDAFRSLGTVTETKNGPLIYIDRGSPVLGVAHLDTVAKGKLPKPRWFNGKDGFPIVNSIALDDRLGAWVLLDLLPHLGLTFDVILCDSEERGRSTAEHFTPTRQYNWGFEFDRAGVDTVLYDYEDSKEWKEKLEDHGFLIGSGSFSDISCLTSLGFCCANFSVGYHHQHTPNCYADLYDTHYMVSLFVDFFKANADKRFEFTEPVYDRRSWYWPPTPTAYKSRGTWVRTGDREQFVSNFGGDSSKDDRDRCPDCGAYVDFYGDCDRCGYISKVDQEPMCPWCDATSWDEDGVCNNCGYDSIMDSNWTR